MKRWLVFWLIFCMLFPAGAPAESSVNGIWVQLQEGMEIFLPDNWNVLEITDEMKARGIYFAVASPDGSRTCQFTRDPSITDEFPLMPTEVRDWFEDRVHILIPLDAIFTVKDVNTGLTFQAHRYGGSNHMVAEPLTAEDTAVMKELSGGKLNHIRRPILIQYAGRVYAASMTTRPSGVEWKSHIRTNQFDGTFNIHFKNSQIAVKNKVDAEHQIAVEQAAVASWSSF